MNFKRFFDELCRRTGPAFGAGPAGFKRLMVRLGNPQTRLRIIHVAGTNGKGSVCRLSAEILCAAGYKTGLFVSPHVISPRERIQMNGRPISEAAFEKICRLVLEQEEEPLNFFEILTAAALLYFVQKKAQYVVLETGLGGRKDPTNVCQPEACIITSVGLDHCQILGNTLAEIAREKAGIIKPGVPVFCPPLSREAASQLRRAAHCVQAPLRVVRENEPFESSEPDWKNGRLILYKNGARWPLGLMGEKQRQNACLAYQLGRFLGIDEKKIKQAFASVSLPCRFEIIRRGRNVFVFDGAHNPDAAEAFASFFAKSPFVKNAALVCGFMKDKDWPSMLHTLAPRFSHIYLTSAGGPRAADPKRLREILPPRFCTVCCSSPWRALKNAAETHRTVAVAGSFYLAGKLRSRVDARKD